MSIGRGDVITKYIIDLLMGVPAWLFSHMGTLSLPSAVTNLPATIQSGLSGITPWGYWLPLGAIATALAFVLASLTVLIVMKTVRIVGSFLTFGGGNA